MIYYIIMFIAGGVLTAIVGLPVIDHLVKRKIATKIKDAYQMGFDDGVRITRDVSKDVYVQR